MGVVIWPEVPLFYHQCENNEQRLKHRIRRAFEKSWARPANEAAEQELGEMLYEKIYPIVVETKHGGFPQ